MKWRFLFFFFIAQRYKFIFFNKKNNFLSAVTKIMKKKVQEHETQEKIKKHTRTRETVAWKLAFPFSLAIK